MEKTENWKGVTVYYRPVDDYDCILSRRDRETAAVNALIGVVLGGDAVLSHDVYGAPFIAGSDVPISISHSKAFAAIGVAEPGMVFGIDVEAERAQLKRVAPRVLSKKEQAYYCASLRRMLEAWTMKEAVYKAAGIPGLEFASEIQLPVEDSESSVVYVRGRGFVCRHFVLPENNLLCVAVSTAKADK